MGKDQELIDAARNGNATVVEKILSQRAKRSGPLASLRRGPGANVQDASGYSALHHAALNGHNDIVQLLLANEASTNILDSKGSSPLHLAAWAGSVDIVRLLLCHGPSVPNVNLTTKDSETALHCAAQYGHTEVVTLLLEHSCDPTIRNAREETALDLAAQYGRLETVELLVRTHPELIHPYRRRSHHSVLFPHTALHLASRNGHKSVVEVLLAAGMDVNVRTARGTPMHEAALCGKVDVVRTLLDAGVDLSVRDAKHNTVLDLLSQFPKHVTLDIFAAIRRHHHTNDGDPDSPLPPIPVPVPSLGSPYENVRLYGDGRGRHRARTESSPGTSPGHHWDYYHEDHGTMGSDGVVYRNMSRSLVDSEDVDQMSVSSATSSMSDHHRRYNSAYVPMGPMGPMASPGSTSSKVSPTPPKKPPRRNLSVSPTHLTPHSPSSSAYEYLFLARSGEDAVSLGETRPSHQLRRGRSADQYEVMKLRQSYITPIDIDDAPPAVQPRRKSEDSGKILQEPVALTMFCDNVQVRTTNPRRKLRRNLMDRDRAYENYDPAMNGRTFVSNAYITLKSSQESLLDDNAKRRVNGVKMLCPLSPTNYQQPPTPDHPPPTALQAELSIHERMRPLSQEYKRRSRDMETETEEELLVYSVSLDSSGSLSSSISLSDKSVSTDNNVEEFVSDMPFAVVACRRTLLLRSESRKEEVLRTSSRLSTVSIDEGYASFDRGSPLKGLFKGSTSQLMEAAHYRGSSVPVERPKTLRKLKNVYENHEQPVSAPPPIKQQPTAAEKSLSILSPFDEQEEWNKISEIMASFSTGLVRDSIFVAEMEKEIQARLGLTPHKAEEPPKAVSKIGQWLQTLELENHEPVLLENGYDDLDFLNGVVDAEELRVIGIADAETMMRAIEQLPRRIADTQKTEPRNNNLGEGGIGVGNEVDAWLDALRLPQYKETFRRHLYLDMNRVRRVWEVELTAVLEISKSGHRRRILASVNSVQKGGAGMEPNLEDINTDLSLLKSNIQQLKDEIREKLPAAINSPSSAVPPVAPTGTGTLRHSHKKNRPAPPPPTGPAPELEIRNPSELLVGVPSTLTTQWRHRPEELVTGNITYVANYLGSTVVKELKGTESTKKSIQKLKKTTSKELTSTPDIILAISYHGVKFLNTGTRELVCEHEIRNIHCACQDADDLTHLAYITKDHISRSHYCHVFCVDTMDQATEVILTLGQAFEVAYQMALREQLSAASRGHTRSQSVNQIMVAPPNGTHSRSLSVNEVKMNGSSKDDNGAGGKAPLQANDDL